LYSTVYNQFNRETTSKQCNTCLSSIMHHPKLFIIPAALSLLSYHVCTAFVLNPAISIGHGHGHDDGICSPVLRQNRHMQMTKASNTNTPFFAAREISEDDEKLAGDIAGSNDATGTDLDLLEKQILAKTQAELDVKRVKDAVLGFGGEAEELPRLPAETKQELSTEFDPEKGPPSALSVALAAGSAVGLTSLAALQSPLLALGAFAATTYVANRDPIKDEDLVEGDLTGPLSRIIGRATLTSIEKTKPAVQNVVRASVTQNQLEELKAKYKELQEENEELRMKLDRRDAVDKYCKNFTMTQLKEFAKRDEIKVGGTKAELMLRLVEAGSLNLEDLSGED